MQRINAKRCGKVTPQSRAQLDRSGPSSETLKLRIIEGGESGSGAEEVVLGRSTLWLTAKMCRFKFSTEGPPRS